MNGCRGILIGVLLMALAIGLALNIAHSAGAHPAPAVAARQTDVPGVMATPLPTVTPYPTAQAYPAPSEPYPGPLSSTTALSLRRTGPTSAELCAPAGIVLARSGSLYRVAYEAWPGGCREIGSHATYVGGDVYCTIDLVCTPPLEGWWRGVALWLPVVMR